MLFCPETLYPVVCVVKPARHSQLGKNDCSSRSRYGNCVASCLSALREALTRSQGAKFRGFSLLDKSSRHFLDRKSSGSKLWELNITPLVLLVSSLHPSERGIKHLTTAQIFLGEIKLKGNSKVFFFIT